MGFLKTCLPLFCLCVYVTACNNNSSTTKTTTDTTETDTTNYALNTDSVKMALNNTLVPEGFYQVVLPCTDCKGIEQTVLFNPDLSFQLQEKVMGKEKSTTQVVGNWKPVKGSIWLYKDSSVKAHYVWTGDTLQFVDPKTTVQIPLRHLASIMDNEAWREKKKKGSLFYGIGNEPFWSIEIDKQKNIVFKMSGWPDSLILKSVQLRSGADSAVYHAGNDSATLHLTIFNTFCTDGMSDFMYNNSVKVLYNGQTYNGCGMRF